MSDQSKAGSRIISASVALALVIVLGAMALSLYLLVDHHRRPESDNDLIALRGQLSDANRRIEELEHPVPPPDKQTTTAAYEQDLKQHQLLLSELRSEKGEVEEQIKYASDLLKEAKETEDRTRAAAALFLGIFGAVATILLGQNYWQFRGWKDDADKSLEEIKNVKPAIDLIRETQATLESKLPKYIDEVRNDLVKFEYPKGPALAKMYEIDHLAYLSNAQMRFKETRSTADASQYLLALLEAARGHALEQNYYGADDRLQEFFRQIAQHPEAVALNEQARGHSIRAFVCYRLLAQMRSAPSWTRSLMKREAEELRQTAFAEVKKSQECDKDWGHGYFVEALLYSWEYVPEQIPDPSKADMFLEGQRKAITIYQSLTMRGAGCSPGMGAWQNLACCLKRVADITGEKADYDLLKTELEKFPTDQQIGQGYIENGHPESEEAFLWQSVLQDGELFAKVDKIDVRDYQLFWRSLLDKKVRLRDWKKDLEEMKQRATSKMAGWLI